METMKLYNGVEIPANGFGVYQVSKEDCKESVLTALKTGYRHIDTAQSYFNESEVGEALKESDVPRKEIFLTTKVWIDNYGEGKTYDSVVESLKKLQTDYLDLILLHQPVGDYYAAYRDLEKLYEEGKVRAIGVSNFYPDRLVDLCMFAKIKPMVNQIEVNVFNQQVEAKKWADKYGVVLEAWAPFAEGRNNMFHNEVLQAIGEKHNKSVAQVILRWLYQRGIVSLAKSVHQERIKENFDIYSFELDNDDMKKIETLDTKTSSFFSHQDPGIIEWFGQLIQERRQ
ncbi:aldo/keto reductase [Faecalitalea cylindroides]|uniref:Organophosphate reductase n=1 Tax=Faecalitalea cylindroides ATCC 27803 TaxID=649755 RepID=U2P974_9FIRM|nr:aldo/keto reductase [Faecalitalea cylindroides]ERK40686.1 organophosphate reductase [[Eubacterium] cylindroides ATCC 27803] [Faecalitalea cylindroides ATCC 27803]MDB7951648.1 aldo/keto reductase [Faecalitalea cylindroides]MDB7958493.1 aldo/keto reductase [Faecalitalea cylindroides]MDB7960327.1 aldo/keto reductase [Faecalitalea cylindroides]MDB7962197.1 aldo/keto reductase [Faecalitalea cylindroides]